ATFKLYRNLDALYDVFGAIVETTGAFGSKDEAQSIENDLSAIERIRRSLADRMETLTGAKEGELARLHAQAQKAQATEAATPKKVVVDDTAPAPVKKAKKKPSAKPVPKPPSADGTPQPQSQ
ncbi:MAG: hypothetical protein JOY93_11240, partial [Acidobacteriales bacterium]|nr:hypothetical protein [Terriglobales bacterium]